MNWSSFNIGAGSAVNFKQPSTSSIALNRIFDNNPSNIFGSLNANGQIFLINQNGFLFGPHAAVNVNTLVASSLNITDQTFLNGILNQNLLIDGQPVFASDGRTNVLDQNGNPVLDAQGQPIPVKVVVDPGAEISTPSTGGGRIMLLGQQVTNGGTLSSPSGQVILAAGQSVYLQASDDPNLRGLVVEVDGGGPATNQATGAISTPTGNVTLLGLAVNQQGRISATTSVTANGSIILAAEDTATINDVNGVYQLNASHTGTLDLGPNSRTSIVPDTESSATAVDDEPQSPSTVNLVGHQIHLEDGSSIVANGGDVSILATQNPTAAAVSESLVAVDPESQVRIDSGASIDVSGSNVTLPMSANIVSAQLRGTELADDPEQRNGALRGQTVYVDTRADGGAGTPIANVSGEIAAVSRSVGQRTAAGGTVSIESEGDAVLAPGSAINVSGGSVTYTGGVVATTELIAADGSLHPIGTASPDLTYVGVLNPTVSVIHYKWGEIDNFALVGDAQYEAGYVQGYDAGTVQLAARSLIANGTLIGTAVAGPYQRSPRTSSIETPLVQPLGGELEIGAPDPNNIDFLAPSVDFRSSVLPTVVAPGEPIAGTVNTLVLPTEYLTSGGFTRTVIYSNGQIELPAGVPLDLAPSSTFDLTAPRIDILSSITSPGGTISLTSTLVNSEVQTYTGIPGIGIGDGVTVDVSGRWVNDAPMLAGVNPVDPLSINGGSIGITVSAAGGDLSIGNGVRFDVSAGAQGAAYGSITFGTAGSMLLAAPAPDTAVSVGSGFQLNGYGLDGSAGGNLEIAANRLEVVHDPSSEFQAQSVNFNDPTSGALMISDELFAHGGFASYSLFATGPQGALANSQVVQPLTIDGNASIDVTIATRLLSSTWENQASGTAISSFAQVGPQPLDSLPAASLTFGVYTGTGAAQANHLLSAGNAGELLVDPGAAIQANPGSTIAFSAPTSIDMGGSVHAPSGNVSFTVTDPSTALEVGYDPTQGIYLEPGSVLDLAGTTVYSVSSIGLRTGTVLPGGSASLVADRGSIFGLAGSAIDVSGTSSVLDEPSGTATGYVAQTVSSAGGSITIAAPESLTLATSLQGSTGAAPGSAGPAGGSVSITLSRYDGYIAPTPDEIVPPVPTTPRTLLVGATFQPGSAYLSTVDPAAIEAGGFSSLTLAAQDAIDILGGTSIRFNQGLSLQAPNIVAFGVSPITLQAPYVSLGPTNYSTQAANASTLGQGTLAVQAALLELDGNLSLQGFGKVTLSSSSDLQAVGVLNPETEAVAGELLGAGTLTLAAREIYPTTLSQYAISVPNGSIDTRSTGVAEPVLSAGGSLTLSAQQIDHQGAIEAPFGSVAFNATQSLVLEPGSLVSVSGEGETIPFGETQNGAAWVYALNGEDFLSITSPPQKQISLSAPSVKVASGATVNLSGGGDLYAYEFVPGLGGTQDELSPSVSPGTYAILPMMQTYAPVDLEYDAGSTLKPGSAVYLSGIPGELAAGTYALLPARYALLPGALLVTEIPGDQGLLSGQAPNAANGAPVSIGYFTTLGTNLRDSLTNGFAIEPGSYAHQLAEYDNTSANTFFAAQAAANGTSVPELPMDAGALELTVEATLSLTGNIDAKPAAGGRGATVDVSASDLSIVSQVSDVPGGGVQVTASNLESLGAQSLLIGGTRSVGADGNPDISVTALDTSLAPGVSLSAPEVLLVAQDSVSIGTGASLAASGSSTGLSGGALSVSSLSGSFALARVSTGPQIQVSAGTTNSVAGTVDVASGAKLSAAGSITLDGTQNTISSGTLESTGSVSLASSQIALGAVAPGQAGLVLSNAQLGALSSATDLELISESSIDFYGDVALGSINAQGKPTLGSLLLDAPALRGFGTSSPVLDAGVIRLTNDAAAGSTPASGTGAGKLQLDGRSIELDSGSYGFSGFQSVTLATQGDLIANGVVNVASDANLTLQSTRIIGTTGAIVTVDAAGYAFDTRASTVNPALSAPSPGLGVQFSVAAATIDHAGAFVLPSGRLTLDASGDLTLEDHSVIGVAGTVQTLANYSVSTPGGAVVLRSDSANVNMVAGASIDVSGGASGGSAGSLEVDSVGTAQLDGTLLAHSVSGVGGGSFSVQAAEVGDLSVLTSALDAAGFSQQQDFTVGQGDVALAAGALIRANNVAITANGGALTIDGQIDARGPSGGSVELNAAGDLVLGSTGVIRVDATGAASAGGTVEFNTSQGTLSTASGSAISAGGAGGGGQVVFRAPAVGSNDVAIGALGGSITGANQILVRVVNVYNDVTTVDSALQATVTQNLTNFSTTAAAITNRLGQSGNAAFGVEAAVELRSAGDMTVTDPWDLLSLRPNGLPGELTLRAAGNLTIDGTLSDGLLSEGTALIPQSGPSWAYRLTGGANLNSANPDATVAASTLAPGSGNVIIGSGAGVETGTGSIRVNAAADVEFTDQTSVLFTAGVPVPGLPSQVASDSSEGTLNWMSGGGNITVNAGVDVLGAVSNQAVTSWQLRQSSHKNAGTPTEWGIDFENFQENVAALGGGNVTVTAGRDVLDLSASVPTTGVVDPASGAVTLYGGGNLSVSAGRNLTSGLFYVGNGVGTIAAGASIVPDQTVNGTPFGTILALGQGSINATAGDSLEIETVMNPTVIGQTTTRNNAKTYFLTYAPTSSVSLTALSGSVTLENNDPNFRSAVVSPVSINTNSGEELWYPSNVTVQALGGDIDVQGSMTLAPSANGNLVLAAENNVNLGGQTIMMSGVAPSLLPSPAAPAVGLGPAQEILAYPTENPSALHADDPVPSEIIAATGDVVGGYLTIPKPADIIAGRDINGVNLDAENFRSTDVTLLQAGRDITYEGDDTGIITVGGPGYLDLFAGRNVDLAASSGISTTGATVNPTLPGTTGATVNVLAGLEQQPAYQAFITKYFVDENTYTDQLIGYVESVTGNLALGASAALTDFERLSIQQQLPMILSAFFNELNESGLEATANQPPGYARGFDAINTLFPGSRNANGTSVPLADLPYAGNLELSFSRIYTIAGGDINLLVPGGLIDVGLANQPVNAPFRTPSQLGIVTQGPGSINAFTYSDVDVNQSRVFTLDGGNILIWSSTGSIDAGQGAKTSISAPPPTLTVDPSTGIVTIDLTGAVAGSGIRTILTEPDVPPGNVNLIAPVGTVNAGDAGIGSAGNINIAAQTVLGASNINFGGTATGVPATTSNVAAGLTGVSNTSNSASNTAVEAATANTAVEKSASLADSALGWLDVFVTGLGEENCKPDDVECLKRQKTP